VTINKTNS